MSKYILYLYNVRLNRYVKCREFTSLNKIKKFYNELLQENPPKRIWKWVPEYSVIEDYYIKYVEYNIIEEIILIKGE